jgi:hypothetical protein
MNPFRHTPCFNLSEDSLMRINPLPRATFPPEIAPEWLIFASKMPVFAPKMTCPFLVII